MAGPFKQFIIGAEQEMIRCVLATHQSDATLSPMPELKEWAVAKAHDHWPTPAGLAIAIVIVLAILIPAFAGLDFTDIRPIEWLIIGLIILGLSVGWWRTRLPRIPKGRIGFGIAIEYEDSEHAKKIRSDFIVVLRDLVNAPDFKHRFYLVELPQSSARRITDEEEARRLASRSKVRFLLVGRARLRDKNHVIDLRHLVVQHAPINVESSKELSKEFGSALLKRFTISAEQGMIGCEFAAQHVHTVARYIIGTAAALSNDFTFAEQLLLDAEAKLSQAQGAPFPALRAAVRRRITELYQVLMQRASARYVQNPNPAALAEQDELLGKLRKYEPDNYGARLSAAIIAFVQRRDVSEARREIDACKGATDGTWRYSDAFLHAYEGDLEAAYRSYLKAFDSPLADLTVPAQSEEFILAIIEQEPDKYWLYFCLGMINHRYKGDLVSARRDFQNFLDRSDRVRFPRQVAASKEWVEEIDAMLGPVAPTETA